MSMLDVIQDYLEAQGYVVESAFRGIKAVAPQSEMGGSDGIVFVWTADEAFGGGSPGRAMLNQIREARKSHSPNGSVAMFYVRTGEVVPKDIRDEMRKLGVEIREPIQFFDVAFRFEAAASLAAQPVLGSSPSRQLKEDGEARAATRVRQPFSVDGAQHQEDLLQRLAQDLSRRDSAAIPLHIVVGPAGAGKSVMFEGLFAHLYAAFQRSKQALEEARRPIAMTPAHARTTDRGRLTFEALLDSYLSSEFTRAVPRELFKWRLQSGYSVWMLDGLDEVISQDPRFFDYLIDVLNTEVGAAGPRPSVLICLRESMLATNDQLNDFLEAIDGSVEYRIYRLEEWDAETVENFIRLQNPPPEIAGMFRDLLRNGSLRDLAKLPFYCHHLLESLKDPVSRRSIEDAAAADAVSVVDVVMESFIAGFINRDRQKELIDPEIKDEDLRILLQECAAEDYRAGYLGVRMETFLDLLEYVYPEDIDPDRKKAQGDDLKRLAFFSADSTSDGGALSQRSRPRDGNIRFLSDVMAEYLFAREIERIWGRSDGGRTGGSLDRLADALDGPVLPSKSLVFGRVRRRFDAGDADRLLSTAIGLKDPRSSGAFRNLMQLALAVAKDGEVDALRPFGDLLTKSDFRGLLFEDLNLREVDFDDCDLTNAHFRDCDLSGAKMDAIIQGTRFTGTSARSVIDVQFGDLNRFVSAEVDEQPFPDLDSFRAFLMESKEENARAIRSNCPAFEELWDLVGRYRNRDGSAKRDWHLERTILSRGRRHLHDREPLVKELVGAGYLVINDRSQYRLGTRHQREFAEFAQSRSNLGDLVKVLDAVCEKDCVHVFD